MLSTHVHCLPPLMPAEPLHLEPCTQHLAWPGCGREALAPASQLTPGRVGHTLSWYAPWPGL
ncbi:hypothetical protein HaLaN_07032 [Haematococcus lacustris]|uniref:Uncharacterized protein n=1 Tax=Haematococcus lacustris TaxID=44745 RepID=A0A699Z7L8_HAELA|nr:hypothetical protein HaLaN_07032 [Haematococcus lacustris]